MNNDPCRISDPLGDKGDGCCQALWDAVIETGEQIVAVASGAANAWSSNQILGAGRIEANSLSGATLGTQVAYIVGQKIGDAASIVTGAAEDVAAGTGQFASVGIATPLAVPLALHGASSIAMGATNLIKGEPAPNGSYTNTHKSEKTYSGKGPES